MVVSRSAELSTSRKTDMLIAVHAELTVNVAAVAQLVEHLLGKEEVMGSSPISSFDA